MTRRLQFSLRGLLLLVTTVCFWLGWRVEAKRRQSEAIRVIEAMGGLVGYAHGSSHDSPILVMFRGDPVESEDGIALSPAFTDEGLRQIGRLSYLDSIFISDAPITDAGLRHLRGLRSLQQIVLDDTRVTEAGVSELRKALPQCEIQLFP